MARIPCTWIVETDGVKLYNIASHELLDHFLEFEIDTSNPEFGWETYAEWNGKNICYRWENGIETKTTKTTK